MTKTIRYGDIILKIKYIERVWIDTWIGCLSIRTVSGKETQIMKESSKEEQKEELSRIESLMN